MRIRVVLLHAITVACLTFAAELSPLPRDVASAAGPSQPSPHLCDYTDVHSDDMPAAMESCIRRTGKRVQLSGNELALHFDNGKTRTFVSNTTACSKGSVADCRYFIFLGFVRPANAFVVAGHCYEFCADAYLINASDGREIALASPPHISPDGRVFIGIVDSDVETNTADKFPTLELYELGSDWLERKLAIGKKSDKAYNHWHVEWINDGLIDADVTAYGPGCERVASASYKLLKNADGWQVHPKPPCE